jgi:hypothetical protein
MSGDLDKLKKALREGEYSSMRASAQNQSNSISSENDLKHPDPEAQGAKEKKSKRTPLFFITLSCILLALTVFQWQSKNSERSAELDKKEVQLKLAQDEALQWQSKNSEINIELEGTKSQLILVQEEVEMLRSSLSLRDQNVIEMLLKYESTIYHQLEMGYSCNINFFGFAEGEWSNQKWSFNCADQLNSRSMQSLRPGVLYVVSVCLVSDEALYTEFGFCGARVASPQEIIDGSRF